MPRWVPHRTSDVRRRLSLLPGRRGVRELKKQARLANAGIADDDVFEEVIADAGLTERVTPGGVAGAGCLLYCIMS